MDPNDGDLMSSAATKPVDLSALEDRTIAPSDSTIVFSTRDLGVSYGGSVAVEKVNLDIRAGEITALIGPSGCGKSTVLRCFNRMNDLLAGAEVNGTVLYHGEDLYGRDVDPVEVRRRIGMVFQRPNPFPKSIYDNVAFGPRINGVRKGLADTVERALHSGRALGRGEGQAEEERATRCRVASSSACASPARSRWSPM